MPGPARRPHPAQVIELTAAARPRPAARRPGRLVPTRNADLTADPVPARVPAAVWAVWDEEDLVGVYADEQLARADAAVLRADAARAGLRGRSVDCLPLQVFTTAQHTGR